MADGTIDLVVGTHALVQEAVAFHDLSLAVVDEQHRFGLHQRTALRGKGDGDIDVLIMTATPIPRTLALTYYGDLDVAVLDEMPAGRVPVETRVVRTPAERRRAEELVREQVAAGRQAFVVCAAIDEANRTQVRAAEAEAERLRTEVFPELRVALLHGRMRPKEKDATMDAFRAGETDVLISTTVIEVGVDVPNATVMLVENAERFGLAQLHQLRGRIGRGGDRSFCVLFDASEPTNLEARARLDAMVRTADGFELADEDLRLRGEGTLFDVRQSGMPDLQAGPARRGRRAGPPGARPGVRAPRGGSRPRGPPGHAGRAPRAVSSGRSSGCSGPERVGPPVGFAGAGDRRARPRGWRLGAVPAGVRPVSDMAREGLFASLGPAVEGTRWLDLFAGTGAVGIEALSRGASEATFVERSRAAVVAIGANLERTSLGWHRDGPSSRRRGASWSTCRRARPPTMWPSSIRRTRWAIRPWGPRLAAARRGMACPGGVDRDPDPRS